MTTYLIQPYDTRHNLLDVSPAAGGDATFIDGASEMLRFVADTKTGVLHDYDAETCTTKRIAYWLICVDGIVRELYTTASGRSYATTPPVQGPQCRAPQPIPTA